MFGGLGASNRHCEDCNSIYVAGMPHTCDPANVEKVHAEEARRAAQQLETEISVWMTKTNEGRFEVWYAEHRR